MSTNAPQAIHHRLAVSVVELEVRQEGSRQLSEIATAVEQQHFGGDATKRHFPAGTVAPLSMHRPHWREHLGEPRLPKDFRGERLCLDAMQRRDLPKTAQQVFSLV